jgi:SAM-dependent methyltransferase
MSDLPLHVFTIVLNGEPFIRYHINVLRRLPFRWHWHIVEGVAEHRHDTAWALDFGGSVVDKIHKNGLSNDGTTEYLDRLRTLFPENVTVYRLKPGEMWNGKLEMVNAPLQFIQEECLLWQIDMDEFWTTEQLRRGREIFLENPGRTAAWYYCHFYVGPNLVVLNDETSNHKLSKNWQRTWRYVPGCRWKTHEPPLLLRPGEDGSWVDVGRDFPLICSETRDEGLIFQHKAYVLPKQLQFKELYYGYKGASMSWLLLQKQAAFPIGLKEFFPWPLVGDDTKAAPDAMLGVETIPLPLQKCDVLDTPRDLSRLVRFIERLERDVYPENPTFTHKDITEKALGLLEKISPLHAGMKVLDVGCGQGPALDFFRSIDADYLGITLSEEDITKCRAAGFKVEKMDQSFLTLPDESQDLVWARHVIEHSIFPLFTLEGFRRVLRAGGVLYLEAPAPETSCHHETNCNHYSVLSKGSWRSLLVRSGFKIVADVDYAFDVPAGPDVYWGFFCRKTN